MDYHNSWIPSKSTISYFSPTTILDITGETRIYSNRILHIMAYYCPIWPYYSIPLPLTLEYWGGVRQEFFWEIFHPITWNIHPPTCFWASKRGGGVFRMSDFSPGLWRLSETDGILLLQWNFWGVVLHLPRFGERKQTWKCALQLVCTHLTTSTGACWYVIDSAMRFSIALFYRI